MLNCAQPSSMQIQAVCALQPTWCADAVLLMQDAAVAHCWDLPPHTFGGAYAQFMGVRGFKADDRPVVR